MKISVDVFEYRGGYALVSEREILAVLAGYKEGRIRKDEFRVWAASHEAKALHEKSKVTLNRILNCKASGKGIKRLRKGEISAAAETLKVHQSREGDSGRRKAIARQVLRAMAQGRLSCSESVVALMYALRRITQRKHLKRLLPEERYARFTYGDLEQLSGIPKANICRAVSGLKEKGFLATVWVVKQNQNQFGLLFVDGSLLTLIPGAVQDRSQPEAKKTTTPRAQNDNAPVIILPTLKKDYPKREIQKNKSFEIKGNFMSDFERIKARARAMKDTFIEQVA